MFCAHYTRSLYSTPLHQILDTPLPHLVAPVMRVRKLYYCACFPGTQSVYGSLVCVANVSPWEREGGMKGWERILTQRMLSSKLPPPLLCSRLLRYCTDELGWRVRTGIKVIEWKRAWPEEAIHVNFLWAGCG